MKGKTQGLLQVVQQSENWVSEVVWVSVVVVVVVVVVVNVVVVVVVAADDTTV